MTKTEAVMKELLEARKHVKKATEMMEGGTVREETVFLLHQLKTLQHGYCYGQR